MDSTTASGYWLVSPDRLFQWEHGKDRRPDLPQVKVMIAAPDPLGMPMVTEVVAGNRTDGPLYIPTIRRVREGLGDRGLLYVRDCKTAVVGTRAFIHAGGDFYLCPLSEAQLSSEELERYLEPVWTRGQALVSIYRERGDREREQIAEGYEQPELVTAVVDGKEIT